MALFERITSDGEAGSPAKISVHLFGIALREWTRGNITRAQVVSAFNLDAGDQTELDAISSTYQALSTDWDRLNFLAQMEDAFMAAEAGFYNKATVGNRLGF